MSISRHQSQTSSPDESSQEVPVEADASGNKLHVVTFGCQMNKYDSELVEGRFKRRGYETVADMGDADIVLFNTCSVRDHAEERTWSWVGELKKVKAERPDLVVGVMGCMAQRVEKEIFKRAGHVDLVAGTRQFHLLPNMVEELRERRLSPDKFTAKERRLLATDMAEDVVVDRAGEVYTGGQHAYLAVMRGCDLNCTYCIVPTTRGRVRSRPIDELVREVEWYASQGVKVITLLGQTINSYGEDFEKPGTASAPMRGRQGRPSLADLLERLNGVEGIKRIRLITLHPSYINRSFAEAIRDYDKVEKFLPLPAQAGSDEVLKRMKRGYTLDLYRKRTDILREIVPNMELGSDWIVGFSGETDADFDGSEAFLEEQGFVVNYVFKYDPRPKTRADERLEDDIPEAVKKERNQRLLRMAEKTQRKRFAVYQGQSVPVFVESKSERDEKTLLGRTPWGMPVSFAGATDLVGTDVDVTIDETTAYGMAGRQTGGQRGGQRGAQTVG